MSVMLKEIQKIITVNASDTSVAVFQLSRSNNQEIFVPYLAQNSFSAGNRWDDAEKSLTCLIFARNVHQWKACVSDAEQVVDADVVHPKAQKVFQKFAPHIKDSQFIPRQRLLVVNLSDKEVQNYLNFLMSKINFSK